MSKLERVFVWLGGALFVASLAACIFTYAVRWSAPEQTGRPAAIAVDLLLFGLFAVHHSVFAREAVKDRIARTVPLRLLRSMYVWTASVLLLIVLAAWQPVGGTVYHAPKLVAIALTAVQLSGLWLIGRAAASIDPLELAGIHPPSRRDALQVSGPYHLVRHPLYLGWIFAVFGAAHMTGDRLVFATITTGYLVAAIPWEERSLQQTFGEEYARYSRRVPWRLIPHVY